ncbi:MAG: hypothetical protein EBV05_08500 [Cyanobacteria bacterium WB6_1B_304]|jgi:hypothetical protein|nr:hypothetical protein [Cyanobacteria bacterium WB6_1B_304]
MSNKEIESRRKVWTVHIAKAKREAIAFAYQSEIDLAECRLKVYAMELHAFVAITSRSLNRTDRSW